MNLYKSYNNQQYILSKNIVETYRYKNKTKKNFEILK